MIGQYARGVRRMAGPVFLMRLFRKDSPCARPATPFLPLRRKPRGISASPIMLLLTGGRTMPEHEELKTLRVLLMLPRDILEGFEPREPPQAIQRYIHDSSRQECQWLLIDMLHRIRTADDDDGSARANAKGQSPASDDDS